MYIDNDLLFKALIFMWKAHNKQQRKYTGEPYINHCISVAFKVWDCGGTSEMIAASLLHDTVEDTDTTIEDIEREFGPVVASYVYGLTDQYTKESRPDLNRSVRKMLEAERFEHLCDEIKTIKLADLIDNTFSIVEYDSHFAKVYLREKRYLLKFLKGGNEGLMKIAKQQIL